MITITRTKEVYPNSYPSVKPPKRFNMPVRIGVILPYVLEELRERARNEAGEAMV